MSAPRALTLYVHLLLYHTDFECARRCIESLRHSEGIEKLLIHVSDNSPSLHVLEALTLEFGSEIVTTFHNGENLGFCAGHNYAAAQFLTSEYEYFLVLNPDVAVRTNTLATMIDGALRYPQAGIVTPLLLRADEMLNPLTPEVVDAAGMYMTPALRHFDRGSGAPLTANLLSEERVFGATGACMLITKRALHTLLLSGSHDTEALFKLYPQLKAGYKERAPLFDEAFFAYREDADLSWRAQYLDLHCLYLPQAVAYHRRVVTPERRAVLPEKLNRLSVRNRFLLQINNCRSLSVRTFLEGVILRNLIVVCGVLLTERASLPAFKEVHLLWHRACERRALIRASAKVRAEELRRWFVVEE